jgi:hypothetical protein
MNPSTGCTVAVSNTDMRPSTRKSDLLFTALLEEEKRESALWQEKVNADLPGM